MSQTPQGSFVNFLIILGIFGVGFVFISETFFANPRPTSPDDIQSDRPTSYRPRSSIQSQTIFNKTSTNSSPTQTVSPNNDIRNQPNESTSDNNTTPTTDTSSNEDNVDNKNASSEDTQTPFDTTPDTPPDETENTEATPKPTETPSTNTQESGSDPDPDPEPELEPELTPTPEPEPQTLRTLAQAHDVDFGTAISYPLFASRSTDHKTIAQTEFTLFAPGGETLMSFLQPSQDSFSFSRANAIYDIARGATAHVGANHLVWHDPAGTPSWVFSLPAEEKEAVLKNHIETAVAHFKTTYPGTTAYWVAVNEALTENGPRDTVWSSIPDYIAKSFQWAHDTDPAVELYYNDYNISGGGEQKDIYTAQISDQKFEQTLTLARDLVNRNVPIDGIGFQMHIVAPWGAPSKSEIKERFRRVGDLGLDVRITELQVYLQNNDGITEGELETQADIYRDVVEACLESDNCKGITMWCFTDKHSWSHPALAGIGITNGGNACLYDANYEPKPAYWAVHEALQ